MGSKGPADSETNFWASALHVETCKFVSKPFSAPLTAVHPGFRVKEAPPFSRVGIDFAGPLYVKEKTGQMSKAYVKIFSCCVTQAVYLESVEDLSAEAFRHCLRKFAARRGMPDCFGQRQNISGHRESVTEIV